MKILFFISSLRGGGAERVCSTLANEFSRKGHDVYVAFNMNQPAVYSLDSMVTQINHSEGTKTTKFWSRFLAYRFLRTLYNMRKTAKQVKPDFVISLMTDYALFSIIALAGLNYPIIVSEHTNVKRMHPRYKRLYRFLYPFASAITVLTRHDYKIWKDKFSNVVNMPNPLSVPQIENNKTRNKWVLCVGRVNEPAKGFDNMMRCWNLIYKKHPEWRLVIAGKYEEKDLDYLYGFLDEGKESNIEFLGFRTDVYDLMLQSEIFALPSRTEGLPMGLMEAMSAGCCCVSFDVITGPSDMIRNNYSGLLIKNQDLAEFRKGIEKVMTNQDFRHRLAHNAPQSVRKFDKDRIINRWEILFQLLRNRK